LDRTDLAHVKPSGASFDDLGRGEEERLTNVSEITEGSAHKSLEMLRSISSTGYLRKRLPQELLDLQTSSLTFGAAEIALDKSSVAVAEAIAPVDERTKAKMQGYEGDPCGDCGNYTLVRNGTCMKCNTCGATSGCS
jgi:ribonucleoside-diphosphate reductase alpha chain